MTTGDWVQLYFNLTIIGLVEALSPVRIGVILVLLSGARPVLRSSVFIAGIALFSLVFAYLVDQTKGAVPELSDEQSPLSLAIGFLLGIGLLILAIQTWRRNSSPKPAATPVENASDDPEAATGLKLPHMLTYLSDMVLYGNLAGVFVGGILMQLFSIKSLLLYSAGLKQIVQYPLSSTASLVATLYLIVIMLLEMIIPTVAFAASPDNSARLLQQMSQWLLNYSYTVLAIVEAALAIYLLTETFINLLS
jgi:hypothetical protein